MSKDIDHILREIAKTNKDIHTIDGRMSKDIVELKRTVQSIDKKLKSLESKLDQAIDILNTFTILITDQDDLDDDISNAEDMDYNSDHEWNPYEHPEDYNDSYEEEDDE